MAGDPPRSSEPNRGQRSGRRELVNTRPADGESLSDLFGREEELARASPVWAVARATAAIAAIWRSQSHHLG